MSTKIISVTLVIACMAMNSFSQSISSILQSQKSEYNSSGKSNSPDKISNAGNLLQQEPCPAATNIIWKKSLGGSGDEELKDIAPTPDGGFIAVGYSNSHDGDVGGNYGGHDFWVVKLDANGNISRQKNYGGSKDDDAFAVDVTPDKGYIVAGNANSTNQDVSGNHGLTDAWVLKLDSNGSILWSKTYGGSSSDGLYDIKSSSDGGYIVAGYTTSKDGDLAANPTHGDEDYWLIKISSTGTIEWQNVYGGIYKDFAHNVKQTSDGGYIVSGYCRSCQNSPDDEDLYMVKVDANGIFQWDAQYGSWNGDGSSAIVQTSDGGYISAGITHSYQATGSLNCLHEVGDYYPTCAAMDSVDGSYVGTLHEVWLVKTTSNGQPDNSFDHNGMRCYGGTADDDAQDVIQTCGGNYLFAGDSKSSDYDVTCNHGNHDFWMGLVNPVGALIWQQSLGGSGDEEPNAVVASNDGNYVAAGYTTSSDGDVGFNHGGLDFWVVKFNISVDQGMKSIFYADIDGDGYGNPASSVQACSAPAGYVSDHTDCNDNDATIHPGATEVCNGIDDNCDGQIDEGVKSTFYADIDGDGYGTPINSMQACSAPVGYVSNNADCDDIDASIHPGAIEACNGIDDNCDGQIDEGLTQFTFYADIDGDGYGSAVNSIQACSAPIGYVLDNTDCDDHNASVHPGATEVCNGIDDNCNGQIDEGVKPVFYADADGDGYGNAANSVQACFEANGYVSDSTDCNDNNPAIHPGAADVCNGIDDNCNGQIDENGVIATINPPGTVTRCKGNTLLLTANSGTGISYQWKKNGKNIKGATQQTFTVGATAASASYTVFESNSFSCSNTSSSTTVTEANDPSAKITPKNGNLNLCNGTVTLNATKNMASYQWYENLAAIGGATKNSYVPSEAGSYSVTVTNSSGCVASSPAVNVTKSCRLEDTSPALTSGLSIYPNPTDGHLTVELAGVDASVDHGIIQITDMVGQTVYMKNVPVAEGMLKNEIIFDDKTAPGMYFVKVTAGDQQYHGRIILQR